MCQEAHDENWAENYDARGQQDGPNIPFSVPVDVLEIEFLYDPASHVLFIGEHPVPVLWAWLSASHHREGALLEWDLLGGTNVDRLTLMRSEGEGPFLPLVSWSSWELPSRRSWVDRSFEPGRGYRYQLVTEIDGIRVASDPIPFASGSVLPARSRLVAGVPNPFNAQTRIQYVLAQPGDVRLQIYHLAGRQIFQIAQPDRPAGTGFVDWSGVDGQGHLVASGAYVIRLETNDATDEIRVTLLK